MRWTMFGGMHEWTVMWLIHNHALRLYVSGVFYRYTGAFLCAFEEVS